MIHWTIAALAFGVGAAIAGAVSARHQRQLRQAVGACRREGDERLRRMEDKLEAAEERAMGGIALAQQRQLQEVYKAGYMHGYQLAWNQRTIRGYEYGR